MNDIATKKHLVSAAWTADEALSPVLMLSTTMQ
ncbi:Uncharacterised protein [Mycobacteroides abscessus subsp. abscessus]|nr:Uncharacterised protein [Mycobacteroides abscessus subsp. abscessus]